MDLELLKDEIRRDIECDRQELRRLESLTTTTPRRPPLRIDEEELMQ